MMNNFKYKLYASFILFYIFELADKVKAKSSHVHFSVDYFESMLDDDFLRQPENSGRFLKARLTTDD